MLARLTGLVFILATTFPAQAADALTDKVWYSARYGVDVDRVHVEAKPEDCDYYYAPVGNKGCHYEEVVTTFDRVGNPVVGAWGKVEFVNVG
jgi:hypothetical protein